MKRNLILIGVIISAAIAFTSCGEKEELSVEESIVDIVIDNNEDRSTLSMYENEFTIDARLIPDGLDSIVNVKITSNADPVGFVYQADLDDGSYVDGKIRYMYKRFYDLFQVALFTDVEREAIKVNGQGDVVTIDIADGLIIETIPFDASDCISINYWSSIQEDSIGQATIFVYNYDFDGTQNPSIDVWSSYDNTKVTYDLEWTDPSIYNGLPTFNNYTTGIEFIIGSATANGYIGGTSGCTVYIEYNGHIYTSTIGETTHKGLPIQQ